MQKIGVFPGSFDPITKGHESIIKKAIPLFDKVIVAIGINDSKKYLFSLEERMQFIVNSFPNETKLEVKTYTGLTVDFCESIGAKHLIRGIRNSVDFEFERGVAQVNNKLTGIDTVFFMADGDISSISSSIVRDVYINGGVIDNLVPKGVKPKA